MTKPWEISLTALVGLLTAACVVLFTQVKDDSISIARLTAEQSEGKTLRDQGYARLQIVERLLNEAWPSLLDTKLQKVLDRVVAVDDKVSAMQADVVRLKTKIEDTK